ncbi:MAG: hypothetical protein WCB68_23045 [Pyrinomonadaceae bacterium]
MNSKTILQAAFILALLLSASVLAEAQKPGDYDAVVKTIESHYHVKHKGVPAIAKLGMKVARRKQNEIKSFKLANFEDQDFSAHKSSEDIHVALRRSLTSEWHALLALRSMKDEAQTYTFYKEAGENFKVLVVNIERRDATVLEAEISTEALAQLIKSPDSLSRSLIDEATDDTQ